MQINENDPIVKNTLLLLNLSKKKKGEAKIVIIEE